ncbi:diacylglycerol kinase family protein [Gryllotalpicola daejeonensis]|uniref:Diacylglycerol kinase family protein n=1 Tax=Gryllotalpicola daejeonensis TaxID=993087 RepID=A0ABP7ZLN3_9MICO
MSDPAPEISRAPDGGAAGAVPGGALVNTVAAVVNPIKGDAMRVRQSISRFAHSTGAGKPLWFETTEDDFGADAARKAVAAGARLVLASGGDGTVRAVAGALRNTGVALGIVPSGTGNLLARNLGLPIGNTEAAVEVAFSGQDRTIDVGIAEFTRPADDSGEIATTEHAFTVVAGVGVDAAMIANTSPFLKERFGWIAYVDGILRSLITSKPVRARVRIDGEGPLNRTFDVHSVLVGNVGGLPGGVELIPDARIDDGVLDVAIMHPRTLFGWLYIGRTLVWENQVLRHTKLGRKLIRVQSQFSPNVLEYARGPVVGVKLEKPVEAELDGDEIGLVTKAVFRADAGSLIVRVPA